MILIDTHAHIYYEDYAERLDDVIQSANDNGVEKIISIGVDLKSSEKCIKLAEKYEAVYATCGIHPHEADKAPKGYFYELEGLINSFHLGEQIIFHQNVNFDQMHTYYSACDALLIMSEHEGFCVPIVESQFHELPIVALSRGAIPETMGPDQLIFDEPEYNQFAVGLHRVSEKRSVRDLLTTSGAKNFHRYRSENILQQLLSLF